MYTNISLHMLNCGTIAIPATIRGMPNIQRVITILVAIMAPVIAI
jgi:hypothetical protein